MTNPWAAWLRANDRQSYVLADKVGWDAFVNSGPRDSLPSLSRDEMGALSDDLDPRVSDIRFAEEHGLQVAHLLLTQPSLRDAASLAADVRGFNPQEGVAPIGPLFRVQQRPRNAVLTAISMQ